MKKRNVNSEADTNGDIMAIGTDNSSITAKAKSIKSFLSTNTMKRNIAMAAAALVITACPVMADSTSLISGLVEQIWTIFKDIGYILAAWGVGQLVLAFKNEDADSKSRAIMLIVAAAVLMNLETIFTGAGFTL